jgi:hypothetical protein
MSTVSQRGFDVKVSVTFKGETRDLGTWDTWSGGNVTADNTKHRRGGMGVQIAIPGPATVEDITVTRDYDPPRDHQHAHWLSAAVGKARVVASKAVLDEDDIVFGRPLTISGILIGYNNPDHDSDSGDTAMVGIVISPDGAVG